MKLNVLALALTATLFGTLAASAQSMVIEERRHPDLVITPDHPSSSTTTVEERGGLLGTEKKTITKETTGSGDCSSKTVHKEDLTGSKTIKKTNCD